MRAGSLILTPVLAFALCLALTVGATFFAFQSAKTENAGRFDRAIIGFRDTLRNRMIVYTNALIYTRNLFNVKPDLTEDEFRQFVSQMALRENYPGIQTVGYVRRMPVAAAREAIKKMKFPDGLPPQITDDRETADIVMYMERVGTNSATVLGLDMSASPERKEAMDQARDSGLPIASDRVVPMQVTASTMYAFLVFVPYYKAGLPISTVEERRRALVGFVYGGFRAPTLFGRITEDARFRNAKFQVRIYDGEGSSPARLMYSEGPEHFEDPLLAREFDFRFADHVWTISIVAPSDFSVPALRWLPALVFSLGLLLSGAVAFALRRSQNFARRLQEDIEVRQRTEAELSQARIDAEGANRAKSVFLANISHEIRTPLGVMIGFAEMALHQRDESERRKSLETIMRNGRELTRIIGDVLDVSKIEAQASKLENGPVVVADLVRDVVQLWKPQTEAKGLIFRVEIEPGVPDLIHADETRIKQVITNLLSNSLKFTDSGEILFKVSFRDGAMRIAVEDTGIGITNQQRERLFKPFSQGDSSITRKYGGSGLGLALSRAIANAMGGDLVLEPANVSASGSRFCFSFPAQVLTKSEVSTTAVSSASLKDKSILLVDDSPDNRALVSLMLKKAEANVDIAVDGDDGIRKALARSYDLILMDIQMPNKDGYTAFKELRDQHHLDTPIIALTAHALSEERDKALAIGFSAYITKPVDRETLVRISAEMLA